MSSGFQLSLLHTLLILLLTPPLSELSSLFLSSIRCSSSRTFRQPLSMPSKSPFWSLLSSRFGKATSASWRTIERVLTLFKYNSQYWSHCYLNNTLICDSLKLTWSIRELFPDLVSQLDCRKKIANAEAKAHRDIRRISVVCIGKRVWRNVETKRRTVFASLLSALSLTRLIRRLLGRLGVWSVHRQSAGTCNCVLRHILPTKACIWGLAKHLMLNLSNLYM